MADNGKMRSLSVKLWYVVGEQARPRFASVVVVADADRAIGNLAASFVSGPCVVWTGCVPKSIKALLLQSIGYLPKNETGLLFRSAGRLEIPSAMSVREAVGMGGHEFSAIPLADVDSDSDSDAEELASDADAEEDVEDAENSEPVDDEPAFVPFARLMSRSSWDLNPTRIGCDDDVLVTV